MIHINYDLLSFAVIRGSTYYASVKRSLHCVLFLFIALTPALVNVSNGLVCISIG